jgi:hypothetical protein
MQVEQGRFSPAGMPDPRSKGRNPSVIVTLLTIVCLIGMWVAVLAAPVLKNRGNSAGRGGDSIKTFQNQLATLERSAPSGHRSVADRASAIRRRSGPKGPVFAGPSVVARRMSSGQRAAQRRRRVLILLVASVVTTLALALLLGSWFVVLQLVADAMLVAYVALMVRTMRIHAEREMKVAFLPHRGSGAEPTALLHEVARSRQARA